MIRSATEDDVENLVEFLQEFHRKVNGTEYDLVSAESVIWECVCNGVTIVSTTEGDITGAILGSIVEHPFMQQRLLQEVAWYAEDNSGYNLLKAFIKVAKRIGADSVHFTVIEPVSEQAERILTKRIGFSPLERSYLMKL